MVVFIVFVCLICCLRGVRVFFAGEVDVGEVGFL